jgi:enoyl-CoA hydratase/carnithine racemase
MLVTLNRPHRRNALDGPLIESLRALWRDLEALRGVRCIVITGAEPGFCSGADMSLLSSDRSQAPERAGDELTFLPGRQVAPPVIVAVNGVCAGGGLHFVADADIVIASDASSFLDPHVSVGQVSALEPLTLFSRAPTAAVRMALIGQTERLGAEQAREWGLISEVVAPDQLLGRALELAGAIADNSPAAVAATRRQIRVFEDRLMERALDEGWAAIRAHWSHPDAQEGPAAFLERRQPRWVDE